MAFIKRLGYYLVGLSIGMVFLTFILKKKGTEICYFPNCRVLKELRSKPISYSEAVEQQLLENKIDSVALSVFLTYGEINFGKSDTKVKDCKSYYIDGELNNTETVLIVKNCKTQLVIERIQF